MTDVKNVLKLYRKLHDGISKMVESGQITDADIEDYEGLVHALEVIAVQDAETAPSKQARCPECRERNLALYIAGQVPLLENGDEDWDEADVTLDDGGVVFCTNCGEEFSRSEIDNG